MADTADNTPLEDGPAGPDEALLDVRFGGYCVGCDRIVERRPDGSCPEGHPAEAVSGRIALGGDDTLPQLPRFNLAAFLIPPVWGPAHGQWVGAVFLPIWLFMDSIIVSATRRGAGSALSAVAVVACTLAFGAFFAKRGNGVAYRRVCHRMSVEEYVRRERIWALASVPAAVLLLGWALWFHLVFEAAPVL